MRRACPGDSMTERSEQPRAVDAAAESHRNVEAALTFIVPQQGKPYFKSAALTGGEPEVCFQTEDRPVLIRDVRADSRGFTLDRNGFELHRCPTAVADLYDDDAVRDSYDPELEALLQRRFGADAVVIFDHTRRSDGSAGAANPDGLRGVASRVHVDYTVGSGPQRAADVLGAEEVERVLSGGGRIVQVNVWRPITGPVRRAPLALADAASVAPRQLVATDQLFPDRVGEIYQVAYGAAQRWYWVPHMERDEVLFIKGWDSRDDGRARFTPHGAFRLPDERPEDPPRESIEVRTFLVYEPPAG